MKLPPLNALRAFECAARSSSFAAAGRELGVTSAAVSQQVRNLEGWLNRKLFERHNNQVRLNDAGRDYYTNAAAALSDIAQFTQALTEGGKGIPLVISASETLAQFWLPAQLERFAALFPDIPVVVRVEHDPVDMEGDGIDIRLTYGGELPDYQITPLFTDALIPVAANPDFDLATGRLIHVDWGAAISSVPRWAHWFSNHGPVRDRVIGADVTVASVASAIAMAEAGVGAALVPRSMVAGHVNAARLACLSRAVIELPRPFVMISAHYKNRSRRMKCFQSILAMSDSD